MAKGKKKNRYNIDWDAIREDYLVQNLSPDKLKKYSIVQLAKTWGVQRKSIERHAKAEDWKGELRKRTTAIADARIDVAQDSIMEAQREIRKRHGEVAKGVLGRAILKFNTLLNPDTDITVEQMLKMMVFALPAEREAHGMPKFIQIQDVTPTDPARAFETPILRMERRRIQREVEAELIEVHKRLHGGAD